MSEIRCVHGTIVTDDRRPACAQCQSNHDWNVAAVGKELAEGGAGFRWDERGAFIPLTLTDVLSEIAAERERQVEKWGNKFDDENTQQDWAAFIMHYTAVGTTTRLGAAKGRPFREAMLKVAALAVAAIEAADRRAQKGPQR